MKKIVSYLSIYRHIPLIARLLLIYFLFIAPKFYKSYSFDVSTGGSNWGKIGLDLLKF